MVKLDKGAPWWGARRTKRKYVRFERCHLLYYDDNTKDAALGGSLDLRTASTLRSSECVGAPEHAVDVVLQGSERVYTFAPESERDYWLLLLSSAAPESAVAPQLASFRDKEVMRYMKEEASFHVSEVVLESTSMRLGRRLRSSLSSSWTGLIEGIVESKQTVGLLSSISTPATSVIGVPRSQEVEAHVALAAGVLTLTTALAKEAEAAQAEKMEAAVPAVANEVAAAAKETQATVGWVAGVLTQASAVAKEAEAAQAEKMEAAVLAVANEVAAVTTETERARVDVAEAMQATATEVEEAEVQKAEVKRAEVKVQEAEVAVDVERAEVKQVEAELEESEEEVDEEAEEEAKAGVTCGGPCMMLLGYRWLSCQEDIQE